MTKIYEKNVSKSSEWEGNWRSNESYIENSLALSLSIYIYIFTQKVQLV